MCGRKCECVRARVRARVRAHLTESFAPHTATGGPRPSCLHSVPAATKLSNIDDDIPTTAHTCAHTPFLTHAKRQETGRSAVSSTISSTISTNSTNSRRKSILTDRWWRQDCCSATERCREGGGTTGGWRGVMPTRESTPLRLLLLLLLALAGLGRCRSRGRSRLALWIDRGQVESLIGEKFFYSSNVFIYI